MRYLDLGWVDRGAFPSIEVSCSLYYCLAVSDWRILSEPNMGWELHKSRLKDKIYTTEGICSNLADITAHLPKRLDAPICSRPGTFFLQCRACFQVDMLSTEFVGGLTFVPDVAYGVCGDRSDSAAIVERITNAILALAAYNKSVQGPIALGSAECL